MEDELWESRKKLLFKSLHKLDACRRELFEGLDILDETLAAPVKPEDFVSPGQLLEYERHFRTSLAEQPFLEEEDLLDMFCVMKVKTKEWLTELYFAVEEFPCTTFMLEDWKLFLRIAEDLMRGAWLYPSRVDYWGDFLTEFRSFLAFLRSRRARFATLEKARPEVGLLVDLTEELSLSETAPDASDNVKSVHPDLVDIVFESDNLGFATELLLEPPEAFRDEPEDFHNCVEGLPVDSIVTKPPASFGEPSDSSSAVSADRFDLAQEVEKRVVVTTHLLVGYKEKSSLPYLDIGVFRKLLIGVTMVTILAQLFLSANQVFDPGIIQRHDF